jgi:hypothetical protein
MKIQASVRRQLRDAFLLRDKYERRIKQLDKQIDDLIPAFAKEERLLMRPRKERVRDAVLR